MRPHRPRSVVYAWAAESRSYEYISNKCRGAPWLRETDRRPDLLPRLAACLEDGRQPWLNSHAVQGMVAQRVYALALGYEDLSDHGQLREDPLLGVLSGKPCVGQQLLAGKSTLNRLNWVAKRPADTRN